MIRTHFDHDPAGTVPYAAIQVGEDTLLCINTALLEQVDVEMRQYLANDVLAELDRPHAGGARVIDLTDARSKRVRHDRRSSDAVPLAHRSTRRT